MEEDHDDTLHRHTLNSLRIFRFHHWNADEPSYSISESRFNSHEGWEKWLFRRLRLHFHNQHTAPRNPTSSIGGKKIKCRSIIRASRDVSELEQKLIEMRLFQLTFIFCTSPTWIIFYIYVWNAIFWLTCRLWSHRLIALPVQTGMISLTVKMALSRERAADQPINGCRFTHILSFILIDSFRGELLIALWQMSPWAYWLMRLFISADYANN